MEFHRPCWDSYFMTLALTAATRSTCMRRQVGTVIVLGGHVISTGYNGSPKGTPHCSATGCIRERLGIPSGQRHEMCRGSHAEMNAIAQAAARGISTLGSDLFCTHAPCSFCTKAMINAGVSRIVYLQGYPDELAESLRQEASIESVAFSPQLMVEIASCIERVKDTVMPLMSNKGENHNGPSSSS